MSVETDIATIMAEVRNMAKDVKEVGDYVRANNGRIRTLEVGQVRQEGEINSLKAKVGIMGAMATAGGTLGGFLGNILNLGK